MPSFTVINGVPTQVNDDGSTTSLQSLAVGQGVQQPTPVQSLAAPAEAVGTQALAHGVASSLGLSSIAPLAGVAAGTYLAGSAANNELKGTTDNSLQGLAGRAQLDVSTGGLAELARPFLGHQTTAQYQAGQDAKITSDPTNTTGASYIAARNTAAPTTGNYKGAVDPADSSTFAGIDPTTGQWVNNAYATSHNVSDLKANDLVGMDSNLSQFGNDWLGKYSDSERQAIDQAALDSGDVKMSKGMADINWSDPALMAKVNNITSGKTSTKNPSLSSIDPSKMPATGDNNNLVANVPNGNIFDIGAIKQAAQQSLNNQSLADKKQIQKNYLSSLIPMNTPLPNYGPIKAL